MTVDERLWNSNYIKVWLSNFLLNFAFMLVVPLLPLYLSDTYGTDKDTIGLVLSGYAVAALAMRPFSGWLVDRFPRKAVLLVTMALTTAFFLGYIAAGSLVLFAIFRTLHGAPFGATGVSLSTVAVDVLPSSRRNEGIGYYGLSNNLAMALSPSIALALYSYCPSYNLLFALSFAVCVAGIALCASLRLEPRPVPPPSAAPRRFISLDRFFLVPGWSLFVVMMTVGMSYGILSTYVAIYGKEELGITGGTGLFFLLLAVGLIVSRLTGAPFLRRGQMVRNTTIGVLVSMVGYAVFAYVHTPVGYYLAPLIIGLGNGHIWPAFQNMFIHLAEHNRRGTANSTLLTSWDLGMGLGVLAGGVVSEYLGYHAAFHTMVVINVLGVVWFFVHARGHYLRHKLR